MYEHPKLVRTSLQPFRRHDNAELCPQVIDDRFECEDLFLRDSFLPCLALDNNDVIELPKLISDEHVDLDGTTGTFNDLLLSRRESRILIEEFADFFL